jgi:hypothetical protein
MKVYEEYFKHRKAWFDFLGSILPDYRDMFPNSTDIQDNLVHVNGTSVENNAVPMGVPMGVPIGINMRNKNNKGNIQNAKRLNYTRRTQRVQNLHRPRYGPISNESLRPQRIEKNNTFRNTLIARRRANETRRTNEARVVQGTSLNGSRV